MVISNPNPACLVNGQATTNGVDVQANTTVTIVLQDSAGVTQWNISCINTDELGSATIVNQTIAINLITKTATFTAIADGYGGSSFIFQSKVNNGLDSNGITQPSFTTTFKISVLTGTNLRVFAFDEALENNASFGWLPILNQMIRSFGTSGGLLAGLGLYVSGGAYNVGNTDSTMRIDNDGIRLEPNFYSQDADPETLVLRDEVGGIFAFSANLSDELIVGTNITAGGDTILNALNAGISTLFSLTVSNNTNLNGALTLNGNVTFDKGDNNFILSSPNVTGSSVSDAFRVLTGNTVNGNSGLILLQSGTATGSGLSGALFLTTGATNSGTTGGIFLNSGDSSNSNTGALNIGSGNGDLNSGNCNLQTGISGSAASGNINLTTGDADTSSGNINLIIGTGATTQGNMSLLAQAPNFQGGQKIIYIGNKSNTPSGNPSGGGFLFVDAGALKYKGSSGTVTQIAPA